MVDFTGLRFLYFGSGTSREEKEGGKKSFVERLGLEKKSDQEKSFVERMRSDPTKGKSLGGAK